jgi:threonine dehydratase
VVATEAHIVEAHRLALEHTGINVSPTGTAGLAGVLAVRGRIADEERVVVVFSGVRR